MAKKKKGQTMIPDLLDAELLNIPITVLEHFDWGSDDEPTVLHDFEAGTWIASCKLGTWAQILKKELWAFKT